MVKKKWVPKQGRVPFRLLLARTLNASDFTRNEARGSRYLNLKIQRHLIQRLHIPQKDFQRVRSSSLQWVTLRGLRRAVQMSRPLPRVVANRMIKRGISDIRFLLDHRSEGVINAKDYEALLKTLEKGYELLHAEKHRNSSSIIVPSLFNKLVAVNDLVIRTLMGKKFMRFQKQLLLAERIVADLEMDWGKSKGF